MLHGRVVRGPSEGTVLDLPAAAEIEAMPGVFKFIRNGAFAAGLAEKKWDAIQAMRRLQARPFHRAGSAVAGGRRRRHAEGVAVARHRHSRRRQSGGGADEDGFGALHETMDQPRFDLGPSCALALG